MLGVVAPVLAVVCKRMQQLSTMLGPAVHREKDTTHTTLQIQIRQPSWCARDPNNFGRGGCKGDHRTKEMLGVVDSKVRPVSNFAKQLSTTRNNMQ